MLKRKIEGILERFHSDPSRKALLLTGTRQVGKTFSVREFAKSHYDVFVEFNLIRDAGARAVFEKADDARDVLLRISAMARKRLVPGKTLIFLDEVQACPEAVDNLMSERAFAIPCAWVLSGNGEVIKEGNVIYMPVYFMMFLKRDAFDKPLIYKVE